MFMALNAFETALRCNYHKHSCYRPQWRNCCCQLTIRRKKALILNSAEVEVLIPGNLARGFLITSISPQKQVVILKSNVIYALCDTIYHSLYSSITSARSIIIP